MSTKIAVLTDIHANLPALQAILRSLEQEGHDYLVHTGDAIGFGPFPAETLDILLNLRNILFVMGNHEMYFLYGPPVHLLPRWRIAHHNWTHTMLPSQVYSTLAQWPYQEVEGVRITLLHYALGASRRDFAPTIENPTPDSLDRLFAPYASDLIFYGHYHPFSDLQGMGRYINPGSSGCYDKPIARYSIAWLAHGQATIEHRCVPYDQEPLFRAYEQRQVPGRDILRQNIFGK